ncbi:pentatricopeptide repeat (PPR-like) superfamily protein [Wolffia australiana]
MSSRVGTRLMNISLSALCRAQRLDMAETLLIDAIRLGSLPDAISYNTLISAYSHLVNLDAAYAVLSRMRHAGLSPNLVSYNSLLSSAARLRLLPLSLSLLSEMRSHGLTPDLSSYNSLIHCLFQSGRPELVHGVLSAMEASGFPPSPTTFNILINGLCKSGDVDGALQLLRRIQKINPDGADPTVLVSYNALIDGLGRSGRLKEALALFQELSSLGISPNAITLTAMMKSFFRRRRWREGLRLAEEFEFQFSRQDPFACCAAAAALIKIRRLEEAAALFKRLEKSVVLDAACNNLQIDLCFKRGDVAAALHLLDQVRQIDDYTVSIAVNGLCRNDRILEAHQILMRSSGGNLVAWNCFIQALCRRGSVDLAMAVFKGLEKKDCFTYSALLRGLARSGRFLEASTVMVSGLREGVQLPRAVRRLVLAGLRFSRCKVLARKLRWEIVKAKFRLP